MILKEIEMRRNFSAIGAILLFAMVAAAQDVPQMETFVGYTYTRASSATDVPAFSANGGGGQFVYNFNKWIGGVADLGVVHNNNIGGARIDNTTMNFLFGPRLSFRHPRIRPYFQVLWGGAYVTASTQVNAIAVATPNGAVIASQLPVISGEPITARIGTSQTAFAMMAGGGLDLKIDKYVTFRPIELDYYLTRFQNLRTQGDNNQNSLRYTTGFNFTFGAQ
jgi:hypothetical protein